MVSAIHVICIFTNNKKNYVKQLDYECNLTLRISFKIMFLLQVFFNSLSSH